MEKNFLTIVIPIKNEAQTISKVLHSLIEILNDIENEIIVVENNSTDESLVLLLELQQKLKFTLITSKHIKGKGEAIREGLKIAQGSHIIIQDADLEYTYGDLKTLYLYSLSTNAIAVFGDRFHSTTILNAKSKINFLGNKFITALFNLIHKTKLNDVETCYKLFKREFINHEKLKSKKFEFEIEIASLLASSLIMELPISYSPRSRKEGKKIGFIDGISALYYCFYFKLSLKK